MSSMSSRLCVVLFLLAFTSAATSALPPPSQVGEAETNDANLVVPPSLKDSQDANDSRKLSLEDYCFADPNFLDVPGQIFFVCPDFCGEGNDWSVFISNNAAPPFTIFTCISKCLPPDEDVFDCTFEDYSVGEPSEVCPIFCPGSSVGGCGLFGLGIFCLNGCGLIAEFFGFCGCGFIRQFFGLC